MDEGRQAKSGQASFSRQVGAKERRKLTAQRGRPRSIWFGLGMLGLIGWSVALPTLLGIALGLWIDNHFPSRLFECLALDGARAPGDQERAGNRRYKTP